MSWSEEKSTWIAIISSNDCAVNSRLASTYHNYLLAFCLHSICKALCMHDFSLEIFLTWEFWNIWQRIHASAYNDVVKLLFALFWTLFVANIPAFTVFDNLLDTRVEFTMRIYIFFFSKALYISLYFRSSWENFLVFFRFVPEPWEFIEMIGYLKTKFSVITSPNSSNVWLLLEYCAFKIKTL